MTKPSKDKSKTPKTQNVPENVQNLQHLWDPHVDSFNFFLSDGLKHAIAALEPMAMEVEGKVLKYIVNYYYIEEYVSWRRILRITGVNIQSPHMHDDLQRPMYPTDVCDLHFR